MPDNWIGRILLTGESEVIIAGEKVHDLIPCDQGAGVPVDELTYPVLYSKLSSPLNIGLTLKDPMPLYYLNAELKDDADVVEGSNGELVIDNDSSSNGTFTTIEYGNVLSYDLTPHVDVSKGFTMWCNVRMEANEACDFTLWDSNGNGSADIIMCFLAVTNYNSVFYAINPSGSSATSDDTYWVNGSDNAIVMGYDPETNKGFIYTIISGVVKSTIEVTPPSAWARDAVRLSIGDSIFSSYAGEVKVSNLGFANSALSQEEVLSYLYESNLPNMTRPAGSPYPYKVIADKSVEPPLDAVIFGGDGLEEGVSGGYYEYSSTNELTYLYPNPLAINLIYIEQVVDGSSYLYIEVEGEKPAGSSVVFKLLDESDVEVVDHVLEYSYYNSNKDYTEYIIDSYDVEYVADVIYNSIQAGTTLRLRTTYVE